MNPLLFRFSAALGLLLTSASALAGTPTIVIAAGATTREEAQVKHDEVVAKVKTWTEIKPAPGYPKLVESAQVKGLKPGFFVSVIAVCEEYTATALVDAVRGDLAGSYTRPVEWSESPLPCPEAASRILAQSVRFKGGELHVVAPGPRDEVLALSVEKSGMVLAQKPLQFSAPCMGSLDVTQKGAAIEVVQDECMTQSCTAPEFSTLTLKVRVKEGTIQVTESAQVTSRCGND